MTPHFEMDQREDKGKGTPQRERDSIETDMLFRLDEYSEIGKVLWKSD